MGDSDLLRDRERRKNHFRLFRDQVEGFGHSYDFWNLIAVRFKKRIVWTNRIAPDVSFEETETSLIVSGNTGSVPADGTPEIPPSEDSADKTSRSRVRQKLERSLLFEILAGGRSGSRTVALHFYRDRVLYALVCGAFPKKFKRVGRDAVFRAVLDILLACVARTVDAEQCELLRMLKRNRSAWCGDAVAKPRDFWHSFYPLAIESLRPYFVDLFGTPPSSQLACVLFKARNRSGELSSDSSLSSPALSQDFTLDPEEFYCCEITFESDELLGVPYRATDSSSRRRIEYVSPMIVAQTLKDFNDSCQQWVNAWLPLYRNSEWWDTKGFPAFKNSLKKNRDDLKEIVDWLSKQTSEKYKCMLIDLTVLKKIFY